MTYKTKLKKGKESLHREIIENFSKYAKSRKKNLIENYNLEELADVIDAHKVQHSHLDWYEAVERRTKELKSKRRKL